MRSQLSRANAHWLRGRLLLARAEAGVDRRRAVKEARTLARRLEREGVGYAAAWGRLLQAGVAFQSGDGAGATAGLGQAERLCEEHDLRLAAAAARRRRGELLREPALVASADEWMRGEEIRAPGRLTEVLVPGFPAAPG